MPLEVFTHKLSDGTEAKFSIWETTKQNTKCYYAMVIGTQVGSYVGLSDAEKENTFGIRVSDGNQNTVYYKDALRLKSDLLATYGDEWLESEV